MYSRFTKNYTHEKLVVINWFLGFFIG